MDLMQSFRTLRKRGKLTVTLLLLVLLGTAGAAIELPGTYQSTGEMILLNSKAGQATFGNPYLSFNPALTTTANILSLQVADSATALRLSSQGYTGSYAVTVPSQTGAPMLEVTVTAGTPAAAQGTLHAVMKELNVQLRQLQGNVVPKDRIATQALSTTSHASLLISKTAKPLVMVLGVGLVLTFMVPQIVERRSAKRGRGKRRGPASVSGVRPDLANELAYTENVTASTAKEQQSTQPVLEQEPVSHFTPGRDTRYHQSDTPWGSY